MPPGGCERSSGDGPLVHPASTCQPGRLRCGCRRWALQRRSGRIPDTRSTSISGFTLPGGRTLPAFTMAPQTMSSSRLKRAPCEPGAGITRSFQSAGPIRSDSRNEHEAADGLYADGSGSLSGHGFRVLAELDSRGSRGDHPDVPAEVSRISGQAGHGRLHSSVILLIWRHSSRERHADATEPVDPFRCCLRRRVAGQRRVCYQ